MGNLLPTTSVSRTDAVKQAQAQLERAQQKLRRHSQQREGATDAESRKRWQWICDFDESEIRSAEWAIEQINHGSFLPTAVMGSAAVFRAVGDGEPHPLSCPPFDLTEAESEIKSLECDNVHRSAARSCLAEASGIEEALREDGVDPDLLAVFAAYIYSAGRFRERCDSEAANARAITEGKRRGKLAKSAADQQSDVRDEWAKYQARIDELCPEISYSAAVRAVAKEFQVSERTVRKRTVNCHPRNGGPGRN